MNKKALLVIDFENDIVHPEGKVAACADYVVQHNTIEKANQAIQYAKQQGILVILIKVGFAKGYHECSNHSPLFSKVKAVNALQLGTWGTDFHEALSVNLADIVIVKPRISGFYNTCLEAILRANTIDTLLLSGVSTENAILSTARDAHDRDYKVTIIEDACAAKDDANHQAVLNLLNDMAIITTTES